MQGAEQLFRPAGIETEGITDVEVGITDCRTEVVRESSGRVTVAQ